MAEELHLTTSNYKGYRCRGITIRRAPDTVFVGINGYPHYPVPLSSEQAFQVGMKILEIGYELAKEGK